MAAGERKNMKQEPALPIHELPSRKALVTKDFVLATFDRHQVKLTNYATRRYHGDVHSARDAVQHTFMQLCKQKCNDVQDNTAAWLYTTCRNRIIDEHRRLGNRNGTLPPDWDATDAGATDPAAACEQNDLLDRLRSFVALLPDGQRDAIELWCHGFDSSEIASITDQKPGTVRVKLHRAIKRLQEHPEVSTWLERATGQRDSGEDEQIDRSGLSSSVPRFPSSTTGERS